MMVTVLAVVSLVLLWAGLNLTAFSLIGLLLERMEDR